MSQNKIKSENKTQIPKRGLIVHMYKAALGRARQEGLKFVVRLGYKAGSKFKGKKPKTLKTKKATNKSTDPNIHPHPQNMLLNFLQDPQQAQWCSTWIPQGMLKLPSRVLAGGWAFLLDKVPWWRLTWWTLWIQALLSLSFFSSSIGVKPRS